MGEGELNTRTRGARRYCEPAQEGLDRTTRYWQRDLLSDHGKGLAAKKFTTRTRGKVTNCPSQVGRVLTGVETWTRLVGLPLRLTTLRFVEKHQRSLCDCRPFTE
jgi:hypothetical protein